MHMPWCLLLLRSMRFVAASAWILLAGVHSYDLHLGHKAEHVMPLARREKKRVRQKNERVAVEVGVHSQRVINLTTPLEDMTSEYIGQIGVGTDGDGGPQFFAKVVFDTGSTNLWVASVLCTSYPCSERNSNRYYNPEQSKTSEEYKFPNGEEPKDIDITFGTGELRGPLHVDTYRVGPLTVKQQPFAMIREMHGQVFRSFPFEGILGLGFRSLSFGGVKPFFERVIDQKLLKHNEFAFYLNADGSQQSAILWGGVDASLYEGQIHMFPVVQPHYWSLELVDFKIGNVSVAGTGDKKSEAPDRG